MAQTQRTASASSGAKNQAQTPALLQAGRCDFHVHTNLSFDGAGNATLANIVVAAEALGMREIGLTDHLYAVNAGQDTAPHRAQCDAARSLQSKVKVYASWEVDYFAGGGYSFDPHKHLDYLDYVLLAHHQTVDESPETAARYLLRITMEMAVDPYANIIAHPFYTPPPPERHGRILAAMSDTAIAEVFHAMREHGKAAEICAFQFTADLRDVDQMKRVYSIARSTGVKFTLDSDAHNLWQIGDGLRCAYVLAELGFSDADFVDYHGLLALKQHSELARNSET